MSNGYRHLRTVGCLIGIAFGACTNSAGGTTTMMMTPSSAAGTGVTPSAGTAAAPTGGRSTGTGGTGTSVGTPSGGRSGSGQTAGTGSGTAGGPAMSGGGTGGPVTNPMCTSAGAALEGTCKSMLDGVYALKLELDVWWLDEINATMPLFDAGRGTITIYLKGEVSNFCQDGSGATAVMRSCGTRLPPLYVDANGGVIQIVFPDELWEKPGIPTFTTVAHVNGFNPNDSLTIDKTTSLIGIDIGDPNGTWPTYMQTANVTCSNGMAKDKCFPDQDGDTNPGITVTIQQEGTPPDAPYIRGGGWHYVAAPTSVADGLLGAGAKSVQIGLRTRLGGSGKIAPDCKAGQGPAAAEDFESRAWACVLTDGAACSAAQANFVDQNVPVYHVLKPGEVPPTKWKHARPDADAMLNRMPSKGPQSSTVRLGDLNMSASCMDIRGAMFPAAQ
jgi:hypothetical protein